jgi:hypothetical protein
MPNQTERIPEILKNIVAWHDGNSEFRKSAIVGLLNVQAPSGDDSVKASTPTELAA